MELWLDTIDSRVASEARELRLLEGITTNPAMLAKSSAPLEEVLGKLLKCQVGPVAVQVTARSSAEMVEQAKALYDFSRRLIIKIPATTEGIKAIAILSHIGIPTMATIIFEPMLGLLAAKAGASYLAPYLSHIGEQGFAVVESLQSMVTNYKLPSKILVAALSDGAQALRCCEMGLHAITVKDTLFHELLEIPAQTQHHIERFEEAWKTAPPTRLLPQKLKV